VRELRKIKQLREFLIFDVGDTLQRIVQDLPGNHPVVAILWAVAQLAIRCCGACGGGTQDVENDGLARGMHYGGHQRPQEGAKEDT
jgi:hypothetical protein